MAELQEISPAEFATTFNIDMEVSISNATSIIADATFLDGGYSLNVISAAYGRDFCVEFVKGHIVGINSYSSKKIMNNEQIMELSNKIISGFGYLNQYEFCLFCSQIKDGKFGTFYGSIDPMDIMVALQSFVDKRREDIDIYEKNKTAERIANNKGITLAEYLKSNPNNDEIRKLFGIDKDANDDEVNGMFSKMANP